VGIVVLSRVSNLTSDFPYKYRAMLR
jgi:hypothetical protein